MSLLKCCECGYEVSEYADKCQNCGCPIEIIKNKAMENKRIENALSSSECPCCKVNKKHIIKNGVETCGVCGYIYDDKFKNDRFGKQFAKTNSTNQPKCPTCGSTNIEKISLTKKATGGLLFGIFSSDVRKQMHCKDCGYKW